MLKEYSDSVDQKKCQGHIHKEIVERKLSILTQLFQRELIKLCWREKSEIQLSFGKYSFTFFTAILIFRLLHLCLGLCHILVEAALLFILSLCPFKRAFEDPCTSESQRPEDVTQFLYLFDDTPLICCCETNHLVK